MYDDAVGRNVFALYVLLYTILTSRYPIGSNVFEENWDLLVVLDACRVDALRAVEDEYPFVGDVRG